VLRKILAGRNAASCRHADRNFYIVYCGEARDPIYVHIVEKATAKLVPHLPQLSFLLCYDGSQTGQLIALMKLQIKSVLIFSAYEFLQTVALGIN
jgi:hypothetical protein